MCCTMQEPQDSGVVTPESLPEAPVTSEGAQGEEKAVKAEEEKLAEPVKAEQEKPAEPLEPKKEEEEPVAAKQKQPQNVSALWQ